MSNLNIQNSNNQNVSISEYLFLGYEVLYGRVGLDLKLDNMSLQDQTERIKEIKQIYKDTWGYEDVLIKKDKNDPLMVMIYVKPNKPYGINYY